MDRIIPEKQAAILLALGISLGIHFAWNDFEAESKKQHILNKDDYFQLEGACSQMGISRSLDSDYIILQSAYSSNFSFATAMHREKIFGAYIEKRDYTPRWSHEEYAQKGEFPGFVHVYSSFYLYDSGNPSDIVMPTQDMHGVLFCPSLILKDLKEALIPSNEQVTLPKNPSWWKKLHEGSKEV